MVSSVDIDPFSDESLNDPFPGYAAIRDAGPVAYLERYRNHAVARHAEVRAVLKDWETFSSARGGIGLNDIRKTDAWRPAGPVVEADPPDHTKVRNLLQRLLSPQVVRSWREAFEVEADALIERLVAKGSFDAARDVADEFVYTVFPRVAGIAPTENMTEKLILVGELNFDGLGPKNERFLATERRVQDILPWYIKSYTRENVLPGGFAELIFQAGDTGEVDPAICAGVLRTFLRGGMDTTVSVIGSLFWILATHPDQWRQLKENPALTRPAIEETIRFESPITSFYRTTSRDTELSGIHIPAESKVQVFLLAANRDPRFWQQPDVFDMNRSALGHVAFGAGIHLCVGQMIARLEAEAVFRALIKRVVHIELDGPPVRRLSNCLRSLKSIPVRVKAA